MTDNPRYLSRFAMGLAIEAAKQSPHPKMKVGACALRYDGSVCGVGYNDVPSGVDIDWNDEDARHKRAIHAEKRCLAYCRPGEASLIACTIAPCADCLTDIAMKDVEYVLYGSVYEYDSVNLAFKIAKEFGIIMIRYEYPD